MMTAPTLGARGWAQQDWAGCKHRGSEMAETLAHFPAWELRRGCSRRQSLAQPGGGVGRRDGRPQATPPPIQVLMSSSRDLEAPGRTDQEARGRPGYQPTWCPGPSHIPLRPPGRPLSPQRLGLRSPGQSVTPAGTNCLHTSASLCASSSCLRGREGDPHTGARQPVGWGEASPLTLNSQLHRSR